MSSSPSPRTALRRMTAAAGQPRTRGQFTSVHTLYLQAEGLRTELRTLLTDTNGDEPSANAIVNTLTYAMRYTIPMTATQCRIYQTVLDHVRGLARRHPDTAFTLTTALAPVLSDPCVATGLARLQQNPDSEYWAALALDASGAYAHRFGAPARDAFLDRLNHLEQTWQHTCEQLRAALDCFEAKEAPAK